VKLPNGFGTVYEMKGNRRNPWIARITQKIENNKQHRITVGCFKEKKDGIAALGKYNRNTFSDNHNITLEGLFEKWSESKFEYIGKSTKENYMSAWKHLSKYKDMKIKDMRKSHFQAVIDSCHKEGKSISSLKKIQLVSNMLCKYAMEDDIITKNYADKLMMPVFVKEEKEIFSDLEIKKMFDNDTIEWTDTILILIYTGMRISELLQLTIFNIDLKEQIITGGLKTDAGKNRTIPIHPKILKYIKKWYDIGGDTLICREGKTITANYYRRYLYSTAIESLGIRKLNPHACRHTFASLLSKAGANKIAIQKMIGHANYSTTADIYTHTDIEELKKAINTI
jgi:integrase